MRELAAELDQVTDQMRSDDADGLEQQALRASNEERMLQASAEKWATVCLKEFRGSLLEKALGISRAIVDFVVELELGHCKEERT